MRFTNTMTTQGYPARSVDLTCVEPGIYRHVPT